MDNVFDGNLGSALGSFGHNSTAVKQVDLSGNVLTKVDVNEFKVLTYLEELNLATNLLTGEIDLSYLKQLETLDLNNNQINRLITGPSVKNLVAVNNNITTFEEEDRKECERYKEEKQKQLKAINDHYISQVEGAVREKLQQKEQLTIKKTKLANELNQPVYKDLEKLLRSMAESSDIPFKDSLQALQDIVDKYDAAYQDEKKKQNDALKKRVEYEHELTQLALEKDQLEKKKSIELDILLKKANATLQQLRTKDENLANVGNTN
ncbi:LRIM1 protein [Anopheles sinensis]|uniref:LRIM1 protein n=1 Tax=Anopheles sinensis TaxID=74873 RepID=A0A084WLM5_ANOSI|nr:LRIM1 protein [Anopheles sinensis]